MITVKEETTLVGISELRTKAEEILRQMAKTTVVIERRHKPVAVMLPIEKYEDMEALLDWLEEQGLAALARKRERGSARKDYIPLDEAKKRLRLS